MTDFISTYFNETLEILSCIDKHAVEDTAKILSETRKQNGRLFILGVGGSAGHATHAVNDFRKICQIESYTPTDNVSELTARINDEGWDTCYSEWLKGSKIKSTDCVLVFSVGGGNKEKNISVNLIRALDCALDVGAKIVGIVGKDGGYTKQIATSCIVIPPLSSERITPHTEGLCAVLWHLLASHPLLKIEQTKWESMQK